MTIASFRTRLESLNIHANTGDIYTQALLLHVRLRPLLAHNPEDTPQAFQHLLQQAAEQQLALAATFNGSEKLSAQKLNRLALEVLRHYHGNKADIPGNAPGWHNQALSA